MTRAALPLLKQGRQPIIYGDGTQKRCFSFIQDCVYCIAQAALRDDVVGEVFNIGPDTEFVSINELAASLADILDFDLHPVFLPNRPQEVHLATCSADKARRILGYKPEVTLRQGLTELANTIRQVGPRKFRYHLDVEIVNDKTPRSWLEHMF